jgi:hypothetical protein
MFLAMDYGLLGRASGLVDKRIALAAPKYIIYTVCFEYDWRNDEE